MHQMTIEISDDTYQKAARVAARTGKTIEVILATWLDYELDEIPVELLADEQVLKVADMMMPEDQQEELNDLLAKNSEGQLDNAGKQRLDELMEDYGHAQIRKAEAMAQAVERGLRPKYLEEWPE
jgi:hypothetical protein